LATNHYQEALKINSANIGAHFNMAIAQLTLGDPTNAISHLQYLLASNPPHSFDRSLAYKAMGDALVALHKPSEAIPYYREALRLKRDHAEAMNQLAWIFATTAEVSLRNGHEALKLAQRACQMTENQQPGMISTLAAAYAENGDFAHAVEFARKAKTLAAGRGDRTTAERAERLRQEFEQNQPHREP
jgi:tetratricopeptide (TPR) repeat protein